MSTENAPENHFTLQQSGLREAKPLPKILFGISAFSICLSLWFPILVVPSMLSLLLSGLVLTNTSYFTHQKNRLFAIFLSVFVVVAVVNLARVAVLPAIVSTGSAAIKKQALYELRHIVNAENMARQFARKDPDGDGIGSALDIKGLIASTPEEAALLRPTGQLNPNGTFDFSGYRFALFLPKGKAQVTLNAADSDPEMSEHFWYALAWPYPPRPVEDKAQGDNLDPRDEKMYYVDQDENILIADAPKDLGTTPETWVPEGFLAHQKAFWGAALKADQATTLWTRWKNKPARRNSAWSQ